VVKSRNLLWAGHVANMEKTNFHRILMRTISRKAATWKTEKKMRYDMKFR